MKERIVIERDIEYLKELEREREEMFMTFPEYKTEQVPETWEELKELCRDIKCCYVGENYISVSEKNISFLNDGQIRCHCYNITNKATLQQMWNIIKNLIGE